VPAGEALGRQFPRVQQQGPSPLPYRGAGVQRTAVVDPNAGPTSQQYFAEKPNELRKPDRSKYKVPRYGPPTPGAAPGTVAFIDHGPSPKHDGDTYIHYASTRHDAAGQGHARTLVDDVYKQHAASGRTGGVDFGEIAHPAMQHLFNERRAAVEHGGTPTYGKIW
jgi:hypothetical protein